MGISLWYRNVVSGKASGTFSLISRALLSALEPAYASIVRRRNSRYSAGKAHSTRISAPVVSVGNLTVGGTGKTPLVCWLAEWFRGRGAAVTIISRGYGARRGQPNDEALELASRLPEVPHLQRADRISAAQEALAANPRQVLILDDAFQHRRIARDLDIVLLDALEPFGYEHLLPRGLLREPIESLARAHVVALSRADAVSESVRHATRSRVRKVAPQATWLELEHQPVRLVDAACRHAAVDSMRGQPVAAFCGLGNPDGFRHTLAACDLRVAAFRALPDHYAYTPNQLEQLAKWVKNSGELAAVICSRKDLVKIPREVLGGRPLWALEIELRISAGQADLERLLAPLAARVTSD